MTILDRGANALAVLAALSKSQAIIEFDLSGKILAANENLCRALGYDLSEIVGRHHSMFVEPAVVSSQDYKLSGPGSRPASSISGNISASAKAAARSGSRRPTIRCFAAAGR